MCKATALLCKTLHSVQLRNSPQTPQRAWAEPPFATHPAFAQKRDVKPVGGRGISAFSETFFVEAKFFASLSRFDVEKRLQRLLRAYFRLGVGRITLAPDGNREHSIRFQLWYSQKLPLAASPVQGMMEVDIKGSLYCVGWQKLKSLRSSLSWDHG